MAEERLLTQPVLHLLEMAGYETLCEAPFFQYAIDIYAKGTNPDDTVAVELKLKNWNKALRQARIYQLCATYVFIAMPAEHVHRVNRSRLRGVGIGLITVEQRGNRTVARRVLQADASGIESKRHTARLLAQFGGNPNVT
jgi:hypothetical protein